MLCRLREFANLSRPPFYPTVHIDMDKLSQSLTRFSKYIKSPSISLFHLIYFTVSLMTATYVKF